MVENFQSNIYKIITIQAYEQNYDYNYNYDCEHRLLSTGKLSS